jgi:hypothetical protein
VSQAAAPAGKKVRVSLAVCFALVVLALGLGAAVGFYTSFGRHAVALSRTIALSVQPVPGPDGAAADALRGAQIYAGPGQGGLRVVLRVRPSVGPAYWREVEVLGTVATFEEAVQRFGDLRLTPAGIEVGAGKDRRVWSWTAVEPQA